MKVQAHACACQEWRVLRSAGKGESSFLEALVRLKKQMTCLDSMGQRWGGSEAVELELDWVLKFDGGTDVNSTAISYKEAKTRLQGDPWFAVGCERVADLGGHGARGDQSVDAHLKHQGHPSCWRGRLGDKAWTAFGRGVRPLHIGQ